MKKFPGKVKRGGGNHRTVMLNDDQKEWLRKWYPVTENERLAKAMDMSVESMRKQARLLGVYKSEKGMEGIRKRQAKAMLRTCRKKGVYEGRVPSEATIEGNRRRWQEVREGKRKSPMAVLKEKDPQRYAEHLEHLSAIRKETFRKEKMRMLYGLDRHTKLTVVVMKPYTRSQVHHRHNALKRGYLLDEDCREGQSGRYVIWYDSETKRNALFEANCIKDGFEIKEVI